EDLGLEMGRNGEGEANVHAARVALDGRVDERLDACKLHDLVELARDLTPLHAEDRAVEIDVLPTGELRMEAGSDFEEAAHATVDLGPPAGRRRDPGENLEQRRLAGSVLPDHAEHLTLVDPQRHVVERPDLGPLPMPAARPSRPARERVTESP